MMEYLPTDISHRILSDLPTVTLGRFKSVCKAWYDLASHPDIAKLSKNPCIVLHSNEIPNQLFIINGNDLCKSRDECRTVLVTPAHQPLFEIPFMRAGCVIESLLSCNGLLMICMQKNYKLIQEVFIYNPLLNKFKRLPEANPLKFGKAYRCSYGFGFEPVHKQYKVIKVVELEQENTLEYNEQLVYVFTLGTSESWRQIVKDKSVSINIDEEGVYADGTLYWEASCGWKSCMVSFGLQDEKFSTLSMPKEPSPELLRGRPRRGCYYNLDIWSISQSGIGDFSWVKKFSIECGCKSHYWRRRSYNELNDCFLLDGSACCPDRATTLVVSLVWPCM